MEKTQPELVDISEVVLVKGPWAKARKKHKRCVRCKEWCVVPKRFPDFDVYTCDLCLEVPIGKPLVPSNHKDVEDSDNYYPEIEEDGR